MTRALLLACLTVALGLPESSRAQGPTSTPQPPADVQHARAELETANRAYVAAFGDGDVNEVVGLYDTAATELLAQGRVVRGRAALLAYWGPWIQQYGRIRLTLDMVDFWLLGDRAFETGKYTTIYKSKQGDDVTVGGNYATEWKRESDGTWKINAVFDTPK